MARSKIIIIPFKRKRKGKTDYKKRLNLLKSGKPRLVIRKSLKNISLQIVEYNEAGDKILVTAHSSELKKLGWTMGTGNIPAAYLTGLLLGKKATEKKVDECIADTGLYLSIKGNRVYAALKGAVDSGLNIPVSEKIFPAEDRISGKHIADFASKAEGNQFSALKKNNVNPADITKQFESVKGKIGIKISSSPKKVSKQKADEEGSKNE